MVFVFEEQRKALMTPDVENAIKMGCSKVKRDGYNMIIQDNTIVTIV